MKYEIKPTRIIHWDNEGMFKMNPDTDLIRYLIAAEIYEPKGNILPIIMIGAPRIIPNETDIFRCIMHTKVILTFKEPLENPINDLVKMIKQVQADHFEKWNQKIMNTPLEGLSLHDIEMYPQTILNKACEIRDIVKQQKLLS